MKDEYRNRLHEKLRRELGPIIISALENPDVIEILLNPDGELWIEKIGADMERVASLPPEQTQSLLGTIASALETSVTRENPILEGELPIDGSRFEGLIPPVVSKPSFTIRKKATKIFTLEDYVTSGTMTEVQADCIKAACLSRQNMLVVGGTGSGKTTLTNAIIDAVVNATPNHRLVIIEDTAEIQCRAENAVILRATDHVDMLRLLKATMRLRPDRILVGEVRGGEALALLKAWNTGHPGGICTVHANNANAGLVRMEQLIAEATAAPMQALIAEAVNLIISIEKTATGRVIKEILAVKGLNLNGEYITENIA